MYISDQQPPVFDFCPGVLNISMGRQGPLPFNFSLPRVTDNSGVPPTLSYSPADIVRQPYPLKNEVMYAIPAVLVLFSFSVLFTSALK